MKILVTGSRGFIGKNLIVRLSEHSGVEVWEIARHDSTESLAAAVLCADAVVHLAGENRPPTAEGFTAGNVETTRRLCDALLQAKRRIPVLYASSAQAVLQNPYGESKRAAEEVLESFHRQSGSPVVIYRLPGVFGKWCRPNYNSVVATFCHNVANGLPLEIFGGERILDLVYVDDVITALIASLESPGEEYRFGDVTPRYAISVNDLATQIRGFAEGRSSMRVDRVGVGLTRALYATFISYLPPTAFSYPLTSHTDKRGAFVEMLKTTDSGQFSFFSAHPGVTRGGHYHHTKTEKFLVIRGSARFKFRHIITGETHEVVTHAEHPQVVDTIPGWSHDITNIGDEEMLVMLWANEVFDRKLPDTVASRV